MKKTIVFTILLFFIFLSLNSISASIIIRPQEVSIKIDDDFNQFYKTKKITVENKNLFSYNQTWYIEHPLESKIRKNRTNIPNLSWIVVEPKWKIIPANEKVNFTIHTNIPKEEKYLDKHWEVWVTFKKGKQEKENGFINLEQAIRVYIDTPKSFIDKDTSVEDQDNEISGISIKDFSKVTIGGIGLIILVILLISGFFIYKKKIKK